MTLLEVQDLSVSFPVSGGLSLRANRTLDIVADISFSLRAGETLGVVGESGSGKTTVIRAVNGLVDHDRGRVLLQGQELGTTDRSYRQARREMAMLFQDPIASLSPRLRVGSLLLEPFRIQGVPVADKRAKIAELLHTVGLGAQIEDRYPHELSGGQARRVGIARALGLVPKLILADEPTAGLDVSIQGQILNLLLRLQRERGLGYVIVTHNLAVVRHLAHNLIIMYLGRIVESGPTADIFRGPRHPYTKILLDAEPKPDPDRRRADIEIKGEIPSILHRPPGCAFSSRCPRVRDLCHRQEPPLTTASTGNRTFRCHFPLEEPMDTLVSADIIPRPVAVGRR